MSQVEGEGVGPIDQRVVAVALAQFPLKVVTLYDPLVSRGQRFQGAISCRHADARVVPTRQCIDRAINQ